jgi:SAM-dependent methyltransferase
MTEQIQLSAAGPGLLRQSRMPDVLHRVMDCQTRLSLRFDRLLPADFRLDGNRDFIERIVPDYLRPAMVVYDVGGGKNPLVPPERKSALGLEVVGLDIDAGRLAAAPSGVYDRAICADICTYRGRADADLVICQALLEHVPDVAGALRAIATILKPGGRALIFVPCRNAVYARINLVLPEALKRVLLFAIFPEMRADHGFPAHYDQCTPSKLERVARKHGLATEYRRIYFESGYFRFCLPLHMLWRAWVALFQSLVREDAAETVSLVLRRD